MSAATLTPPDGSRRFLDALRAGDARRAEAVADSALRSGMPFAQVQDEVVAPAMREVGRLWSRGEMSVAEEHLATAITFRVLNRMGASAAPPRDDADRGTVLLAALEGEHHVVGLEMVARVLESAGFGVLELGADVPTGDLVAAVDRFRPGVVGLSTTMPALERFADAVSRLRALGDGVTVLVGGMGVPEAARRGSSPRFVPSAQGAVAAVGAAFGAAGA